MTTIAYAEHSFRCSGTILKVRWTVAIRNKRKQLSLCRFWRKRKGRIWLVNAFSWRRRSCLASPQEYICVRAFCFRSKVSLFHNGGASSFGKKYRLEWYRGHCQKNYQSRNDPFKFLSISFMICSEFKRIMEDIERNFPFLSQKAFEITGMPLQVALTRKASEVRRTPMPQRRDTKLSNTRAVKTGWAPSQLLRSPQ